MGASVQTAAKFMPTLIHGERWKQSTALPSILNRHNQENTMNKDQAKGRIEEVKGKVKEVAGQVTGNKDLEKKGKFQKFSGKVQAGYGDLKEDIKHINLSE